MICWRRRNCSSRSAGGRTDSFSPKSTSRTSAWSASTSGDVSRGIIERLPSKLRCCANAANVLLRNSCARRSYGDNKEDDEGSSAVWACLVVGECSSSCGSATNNRRVLESSPPSDAICDVSHSLPFPSPQGPRTRGAYRQNRPLRTSMSVSAMATMPIHT